MSLEHSTALTLRIGVVAGLVLTVIGLIIQCLDMGDGIIYAGILILIASPFLGVVTTTICLFIEKDIYWGIIGAILLAITGSGIMMNIFF